MKKLFIIFAVNLFLTGCAGMKPLPTPKTIDPLKDTKFSRDTQRVQDLKPLVHSPVSLVLSSNTAEFIKNRKDVLEVLSSWSGDPFDSKQTDEAFAQVLSPKKFANEFTLLIKKYFDGKLEIERPDILKELTNDNKLIVVVDRWEETTREFGHLGITGGSRLDFIDAKSGSLIYSSLAEMPKHNCANHAFEPGAKGFIDYYIGCYSEIDKEIFAQLENDMRKTIGK